MHRMTRLAAVIAVWAAAAPARAEAPATIPADAHDASPDMVSKESIRVLVAQLSSDSYAARQSAMVTLRQAISQNQRQVVLVQEMLLDLQANLAEQLRALTDSNDGEAQARLATLVEFNEGISAWAADAMRLPEGPRKVMLAWGFSPGRVQIAARAYSRRAARQVEAARDLAGVPGDEASWVLARLIDSPKREVSIAAMDAAWDRPPAPPVTEALWNRAVKANLGQVDGLPDDARQGEAKTVPFRGRDIEVQPELPGDTEQGTDGDLATEVLVHYKDDQTRRRLSDLIALLSDAKGRPGGPNAGTAAVPNYGGAGINIAELMKAFRPKEGVRLYIKLLNAAPDEGNSGDEEVNNFKMRYTVRTEAIAVLCAMTDQDPQAYRIRQMPNMGNRQMVFGGAKEENQAAAKMIGWWNVHHNAYGVAETEPAPATSPAPPETPASAPAGNE